MENETKRNIETIFKELEELLYSIEGTEEEISKEALNYVEWMLKKAQLRYKYSRKEHSFPILYGRIYWAHLGVNVGSEEDKHRPVVIIKSERKSPICYIVPLTSQRLEDGYWYHIDLEGYENTALVEHFKTISKDRIDSPLWKAGEIAEVSKENMHKIHNEIKRMFTRPPKS